MTPPSALRELQRIRKRGLIAVSAPAPIDGHTVRAGTITVCKILGLDYKLVPSRALSESWVCVTPEVEAILRAVKEAADCVMVVVPEAARRLADKRDVLIEFDAHRRLGADDNALFDLLALAGVAGEKAQFEARCHQRNPRRSDRSIANAWAKAWVRMRRRARARNLKTKR